MLWHELPDGGGCWYLLKHADVAAASKDPATFSAARGGIVIEEQTPEALARVKTQLLSMDPPEHREMRNLVLTAFTPKAIDAMASWLRDRSREIMQRAAAGRHVRLRDGRRRRAADADDQPDDGRARGAPQASSSSSPTKSSPAEAAAIAARPRIPARNSAHSATRWPAPARARTAPI